MRQSLFTKLDTKLSNTKDFVTPFASCNRKVFKIKSTQLKAFAIYCNGDTFSASL